MNLRTFIIISAVLALIYGLGLVFMPVTLLSMYGFGIGASEKLLSQFFGSELLVLGVIAWLSKDSTGTSVRPLVTGNVVGNTVGTIVSLIGVLNGTMNAVGWSAVGIYLFLTLGFGYFQFMAPSK
jgi:hypothetical protein